MSYYILPNSHTSPETAYVIMDYPFGRRLRCMKRIWIETKPGRGQRFCYQTTKKAFNYNMNSNSVPPMDRPGLWNNAKRSTYSTMCLYAINPETDYVENFTIDHYATEKSIGAFVNQFYDRMSDDQRMQLNSLLVANGLGHMTETKEAAIY